MKLNKPSAADLPQDDGEQSPELQGLVHALLRRAWAIILVMVLLGAAAAWYANRLPDRFESRVVIQIESDGLKAIPGSETSEPDLKDPVMLETVIQNLKSRALMLAVVRKLELTNNPTFLGAETKVPVPETDAAARLLSGLSVASRPRTLLLDLSYAHQDPELAQLIAATISDQFLQRNTEQQLAAAQGQTKVLTQKAAELKEKLRSSEQAVQAYKNQAETVSLDEGRNLVEAKLTELNASLSTARTERMRLEADLRVVQQANRKDAKQLLTIASVAADPDVVAAQTRVKTLEAEVQALSDRFRAKHPRMIEAQSRLQAAQETESEAIKAAPERMEARFASAQVAEQTLEKAAATQERELLKLDEKVLPYRALQKELEDDRLLFEQVQRRLKESAVTMDRLALNFRIVEAAGSARQLPSRKAIIIAAAVLAGAIFTGGIIAAFYFLDSSIKTVDEAERLLDMPVLSAIPKLHKTRTPAELLALLDKPDSPVAESFRSLRTALSLLGPVAERKVLLFTSAVPSEGKTLTAANAAIALAQQGLRTVVVDADLRRPKLTGMFLDPATTHPGLAEFLVEQPLAVRQTEIPRLSILPAGMPAPNPAELLANGRFQQLIDTLKEQYDRVVIDTAPVNVVSDTLSLVSAVQTIVLVVRNGSTSRKLVRRAIELLRRAHVRPDGVVLNFMPHWSGMGNHYSYSSSTKYGGEATYGSGFKRPEATTAAPTAS